MVAPEPIYDQIPDGAQWTGLIQIDKIKGQKVAPQSISRDL